ncbi:unnamed protein product, partial [Rotaria sordida]
MCQLLPSISFYLSSTKSTL